MTSASEAADRILSRLRVEKAQEDTPKETTCPYDCSSEFQTLDHLNEYVQRLDSDVMTLEVKNEAQRDETTRLDSLYRSLRYDHERVKGEIEQIKETVRIHGERLDDLNKRQEDSRILICENVARIDKLEQRTNDVVARLDDEKRERKDSDLKIWGFFGFLGLLWLLNGQRPIETQTRSEFFTAVPAPTPQRMSPATTAAYEYVRTKAYFI